MPPTLEVAPTNHPPRLNLRRTASYTLEKGPLSSTSARFNFNHLVFASPPPSPGLPQLVPRKRKLSNAPRPSRVVRVALWIAGVVLVSYLAASTLRRRNDIPATSQPRRASSEYEMVGQDALPKFPTPIVVTDRKGKAKWTVSIPPNYDFPLSMAEYSDICSKCYEVADEVDSLNHPKGASHQVPLGHAHAHRDFVDVHEAEVAGFLPGSVSIGTLLSQQAADGDLIGETKTSLVDKPVCRTSLTFVLASADAGLGQTLMLLWMSYALAQKEGRSFFIDDTRWAYGKYTGIFETPPLPDCRPPLRHEMLPCPRQARHMVVTAETAKEAFGGIALDDGRDPSRQRAVFDLARRGYEALCRLNKQDADYVSGRVAKLKARIQIGDGSGKRGIITGLHVRRGDGHPLEFQYRESYMPINVYTERAREVLNATFHSYGPLQGEMAKGHSLTVLASDDPLVYDADEFVGAARAQEQIRLASKKAIQQINPDRHAMHKFVDETFGWEGGFFAAMFWNLGLSSLSAANAAKAPATKLPPSSETMRLRSLVGRAYMMDLTVLSRASDVVICTVGSMGCRLLAVMMGWEPAIERGNWVNIDGDYGWMGVPW